MKQRKPGRMFGYTAIEALESPEVYERARRIHYTMQDNGSATGPKHRITDEQIWAAVDALDREQVAERRLSGAESDLLRLGYRLVGGEWRKGEHE